MKIHRTIIFPLVLYGRDTSLAKLREESRKSVCVSSSGADEDI